MGIKQSSRMRGDGESSWERLRRALSLMVNAIAGILASMVGWEVVRCRCQYTCGRNYAVRRSLRSLRLLGDLVLWVNTFGLFANN